MMIGRIIALGLAAILLAQARSDLSIRDRAQSIPAGSVVEVKLTRKQAPTKLVGRLGAATGEGIQIEISREDTTETVQVAFTEMKSLKVLNNADDPVTDDESPQPAIWSRIMHGFASLGALTVSSLLWVIGD
jgi:hypothetical protein